MNLRSRICLEIILGFQLNGIFINWLLDPFNPIVSFQKGEVIMLKYVAHLNQIENVALKMPFSSIVSRFSLANKW